MPKQSDILTRLAAAGYTVEFRTINIPGRYKSRRHRAIARKGGIIAAFASAATDDEALALLAEWLGLT